MKIITDSIRRERIYGDALQIIGVQARSGSPRSLQVTGLCKGAKYAFYAALCEDIRRLYGQPVLFIVPDERAVRRICDSLESVGLRALPFPLRDFVFHNAAASHDFEYERLHVLSNVISGSCNAVVATPDAALQYTIPRDSLAASTLNLTLGDSMDVDKLIKFLNSAGYTRTEMVDGTGQYSNRGGIIDVYPSRSEYPVRIDFFGDEIEQIGIFDTITQRRIENIDSFQISPAREVLISEEIGKELQETITAQLRRAKDEAQKQVLSGELEALKSDRELAAADKYISLIYPEKECLFDYFDNIPLTVFEEYPALCDRLKGFEMRINEAVTSMLESGVLPAKYAEYCKRQADFDIYNEYRPSMNVDLFTVRSGRSLSGNFAFNTKQTISFAGNFELLIEELETYRSIGYTSLLLCESEQSAANLHGTLSDSGIASVLTDGTSLSEGFPNIAHGVNFAGFELPLTRFACLSMYANPNAVGRSARERKRRENKRSAQERIMSYADLNIGDYVVHVNHGIGQYHGIETITFDGITRDYIKLQYAGTDVLYIPTDQLDMISKYIGARSDDGQVKLTKMGGSEWVRAKQRAKKAAANMAKELIALYAERLKRDGFAFYPDDEMQREFESAFEHEETDGQLSAVSDIKADMEASHPMDRLLCGDVGFGKTEVALRAAFKAVAASKQVAILVPTTILAMQHYNTLCARMRGFPVSVDFISRFKTPQQQAETIRRLRRGEVDILVGTHRLLSNDVTFKDLGLLIVDEEQRFGVAQKEKIKQLAANIDVLTLTATPIPRTLNMAMSGIRDMSVLEEAPRDRIPVQTYVLEYDDVIIADAINRELRRGGQVFYLHNDIGYIDNAASRVREMAPDARIATAHGQMDRELLSDIWRDLVTGDLDILVSTTIIETGVDVPNANTLIIENADRMGLSQLHQLRGRVGRSSRRAYAYFTYRRGKALSEIAAKRLTAIRDFTEFGSGFKIAMRDLEIRGAGNLLGAEQHGQIESVGYDMYMRILNEAILEEKGIEAPKKIECTVDIKCDAFIPDKYIASPAQRIDAYKKIASIENDEDVIDITDELLDRYGDPPQPVLNLINISLIRGLGAFAGMSKIQHNDNSIVLWPEYLDTEVWTILAGQLRGRLLMNVGARPYITCRLKKEEKPIDIAAALLKKYNTTGKELHESK